MLSTERLPNKLPKIPLTTNLPNQPKGSQSKNSDNSETNHRIVAVYNLHCFLYDVGKPIGRKLGMKSLVCDFVKNHFTFTIAEYPLCWFACISYLTNPIKTKNSENEKKECFLLWNISFTSMTIKIYWKKRKT
jgi:hypothetical protein